MKMLRSVYGIEIIGHLKTKSQNENMSKTTEIG
jgi:hypothetical protein